MAHELAAGGYLGVLVGYDAGELRPDEEGTVEIRRELDDITLPVKKGRRLGSAAIFAGGEYLGSVGLLADRSVEADGFGDKLIKIIKELM